MKSPKNELFCAPANFFLARSTENKSRLSAEEEKTAEKAAAIFNSMSLSDITLDVLCPE